MLPKSIVKRDGRIVPFDLSKIENAILKAFNATKEVKDPESVARSIAVDVVSRLNEQCPTVEHIQDVVERRIMARGCYETAKAYILYRDMRTRRREFKSDLMETVGELMEETSRENANIGNTPSGKFFQIGGAASAKRSFLDMPERYARAHQEGLIHIHDAAWHNLTVNCLQIPLGELLSRGFRTQNGWVRPPKRISSACALAAIIMQTSQNDMFGGQSFAFFDRDMAPYAENASEEEVYQAMESFLYNMSMMQSRAGGQVVFSSINLGADTTPGGRKVTRCLLKAYEAGLGKGEPFIFPNVIFRLKKGVNFDPQAPNYDLFRLACRVAARRMNPTFSFMDSSFNAPYGDQIAYMGCRTRVIGNRRGPEVTEKRGNLFFASVNLPRVAVLSRGDVDKFWKQLGELLDLAVDHLRYRYRCVARLRAKDLPFVMGQKLYLDSEALEPDDSIEPAVRHGSLSVGFIGLAECLNALVGQHHGEDKKALALAEEIVRFMRGKVDEACEKYDLNFALLATPAEGLCGRFVAIDKREFGVIPGVTNKGFYTNSYHLPVDFPVSIAQKIEIEGRFHKYCNGGHISYIELASPPEHNSEAVEAIVRHMAANDMGYAGINYPLDSCADCGHTGIIPEDECPGCGGNRIQRIRRITGYLSTVDRFNDAKLAELSRRRSIRL